MAAVTSEESAWKATRGGYLGKETNEDLLQENSVSELYGASTDPLQPYFEVFRGT